MNIAIDFGGTTIKLGLVREGEVLAKAALAAHAGAGLLARLPDVEGAVRGLLADVGAGTDDCAGVGIAFPGIVDSERKKLIPLKDKYDDAQQFDFGEWAERVFGLPLAMENDARAALLGEIAYGAARGEKDAVLVIFGTGIGTSAMMDGRIVRGRHHQAGILGGHLTTNIYGATCICGGTGCLEAQAGQWAIKPRMEGMLTDYPDSILSEAEMWGYETIVGAAMAGDALAVWLESDLICHWSAGIANMIHAYDPEVVVLSGGLMKSADRLLPRLVEGAEKAAWTPWGMPRFVVVEDPEASVLLGMSYLAGQLRGN